MFATRPLHRTPAKTFLALALLLAAGGVACGGDDPNQPPESPLTGLPMVIAFDSLGNAPAVPASSGPGYFRGTVLGESAPGAGNDSLETAPRIEGAVVTAYPVLSGSGASVEVGDAAASVATGADGKFTLPTLPGGPYVVTITPPAGSPYTAVQVSAPVASPTSHDHPWWIVLWDPTN